jgi:hypothetical protein
MNNSGFLSRTYGLFILAALLVCSPGITPGQTPPHVTTAVTAASGTCPSIPASKNGFIVTDPQVWFDFTYTGGNAGDKYSVEWVEPNGAVYTTDAFSQTGNGGGYCYNWYLSISGFPPDSIWGTWTVKLLWNGSQISALPFNIGTAPLPSMTVNPKVVNVTVSESCPVAKSPCSFSYQASPTSVTVGSTGASFIYNFSAAVYNSSSNTAPDWIVLSAPMAGSLVISGNPAIDPTGTTGIVTLSSSAASNSPQVVNVTTQFAGCTGAGCPPRIETKEAGKIPGPTITGQQSFTTSSSMPQAVPQAISNAGADASQVTTSVCYSSTTSCVANATGGWLSVPTPVPSAGTFNMTVQPAGLTPGQYQANVTFTFQIDSACTGNTCQADTTTIPITLTVSPGSLCGTSQATPGNLCIGSLSPPSAVSGASTMPLVINGTGFANGDKVTWNQTTVQATSISATAIGIQVPASFLTAGTAYVVVTSPSGTQSNTGIFTVTGTAAVPEIISVTPPSAAVGSTNVQLQVAGSGFTSASTAKINGLSLPTQFMSSTLLQAQVNPGDLTTQGTSQITVANPTGPASGGFPFVISGAPLQFRPVTPCRIFDSRLPPPASYGVYQPNTTFGSPYLAAGAVRNIPLQKSNACPVPANAGAYSLNFTVAPRTKSLASLTVWPGPLQPKPNVSTLTSLDGQTIASAGIVPAGADGSINVSATDDTEVFVDINGVFVPPGADTLQFYPLPPCRVLDTRTQAGYGSLPTDPVFGPPVMTANAVRSFPISSPTGPCHIPANAAAYSLNVTAVPRPGGLGFLAFWPSDQPLPNVSTLNSFDGTLLANAAIVPASPSGAISALATSTADIFADINGFFAPPGAGGLNFYAIAPCRIVDTRTSSGPFGGPSVAAYGWRDFSLPEGPCGLPIYPGVQVYSLAVTAFPQGVLDFLTLSPSPIALPPQVSTLNPVKGLPVANAALLPGGADGSIAVYDASSAKFLSDVTIDTAGYFGP